jgi:hypothetical protein
MKLRAGSYGEDMWPPCREHGVAVITHPPIYDIDLTKLRKTDLDAEVKTAARSSIWRFAWDIRGGDIILVGDSRKKSIIGKGYVTSEPGIRAYRYNTHNPIREKGHSRASWRHEIPVVWDDDFLPFTYVDGAPRHTVMHFDPTWASAPFDGAMTRNEGEAAFLNEAAYRRDTQASYKNVLKLHTALSNRFRAWLKHRFEVVGIQEKNQLDIHFTHDGTSYLVELKICYGGNSKAAIREALGQIIEYNHYPPRLQKQRWLLVLDSSPTVSDKEYIAVVRERYNLPLGMAWPLDGNFEISPPGFLPQNTSNRR